MTKFCFNCSGRVEDITHPVIVNKHKRFYCEMPECKRARAVALNTVIKSEVINENCNT
jgi:hypothetical protein